MVVIKLESSLGVVFIICIRIKVNKDPANNQIFRSLEQFAYLKGVLYVVTWFSELEDVPDTAVGVVCIAPNSEPHQRS